MNSAKISRKTELTKGDKLFIAHLALNAHKPHYYVMSAVLEEPFVKVDYMDENSMHEETFTCTKQIHVKVLTDFVDNNYCTVDDDYRTNYQYLLENLDEVVTDFLNKAKVQRHV